ncbi:AAA family ATPase [Gemella bergeri]
MENIDKDWEPKNYSPDLSVDDWVELIRDETIFNKYSLQIMKRIIDYGGQATCKQLSMKYGESINFYNAGSIALAKRIVKKTNCKLNKGRNSKYWPILYVGKYTENKEEGTFIWKIRDELLMALQKIDLSDVNLYDNRKQQYWFLNANPKIWSISKIPIGEQQEYTLYGNKGRKRSIFKNFIDAKIGDIVLGYESSPIKKIVSILCVCKEQDGEKIYFEKCKNLSIPIDFSDFKKYPGLQKMEYFKNPRGSLFKLTESEYNLISEIIKKNNMELNYSSNNSYSKKDFLNDTYMCEEKYDSLVSVLKKKKNIILQGAPGVGKTFAAKRLAYSILNEKNEDFIEFIQFHQNYSYEDFVMGYKPVENGFKLKLGIFYNFCKKAERNPNKDYFLIIDEINRGNLSKIFGELLMLIESDYREEKITLSYGDEKFSVPKNLYIIGMMNTADRSLAMIDYALRRRFSFISLEPGFTSKGFLKYQENLSNDNFNKLIEIIKELNQEIIRDKALGSGFCLGHSYFCNINECTNKLLKDIIEFDIIPMISEYWFDEEEKLLTWNKKLCGIFNEK